MALLRASSSIKGTVYMRRMPKPAQKGAEQQGGDKVRSEHAAELADVDDEITIQYQTADDGRYRRRYHNWRQGDDRVGANDQLERVEGAGRGRVEGSGDGACRD